MKTFASNTIDARAGRSKTMSPLTLYAMHLGRNEELARHLRRLLLELVLLAEILAHADDAVVVVASEAV